jgi:signal transduction histidine kinase
MQKRQHVTPTTLHSISPEGSTRRTSPFPGILSPETQAPPTPSGDEARRDTPVDVAQLDQIVEQRTQELLHLQDARARERRLAAVGQLAAGVMHDVNNALNPIMAAAHLLMLHADDPIVVRDYAMRIAKAAETGAATAARVGRFIRQEPHSGTHEELTDLSEISDEVIAMTRPLWSARALGGVVELRRDLVDGALTRGMPAEVREALINLVQNALDAMASAGGGTLGVATRVERHEAIVEVSDTGHGMTPEVVERAFEPFFTTKGSQGTGLGLSEVYGIMKRHRGRTEISSTPGVGTAVRLVFPLATALTPSGEIHAFLDRVPKRVLLVDPDDASREEIAAILVADGHVVDDARMEDEALARLDAALARNRRYDLLLAVPMDADAHCVRAVIDAARARWVDIQVGVLLPPGTAGADEADASLVDGADFILRRPIRTEELLMLVGAG